MYRCAHNDLKEEPVLQKNQWASVVYVIIFKEETDVEENLGARICGSVVVPNMCL